MLNTLSKKPCRLGLQFPGEGALSTFIRALERGRGNEVVQTSFHRHRAYKLDSADL